MARRSYSGNAPATTLNGGINASTLSIVVTSATGYPAGGASGPFFIVIDRGLTSEEKVLCDSVSGATFTVNAAGRGADGTTGASHVSGAIVEHCITKTDADEANAHVNDATTDAHTQYIKTDGTRAFSAVTAIANSTPTNSAIGDAAAIGTGNVLARSTHVHGREGPQWISHTFSVAGDVAVPVGQLDFINPMFASVASGRTVKLAKCKYKINSGTSATCKLQINGVDATGFTGISVTTTAATTDPTNISLADGDVIALIVTAVSGSPVNMSFTITLEHA